MPMHALTADRPATSLPAENDTRALRSALGAFATGVTIVTTCVAGERAGVTVNSFSSVSLEPPLVLWSLALTSRSLTLFERAEHFAINVLGDDQGEIARSFAERDRDRFAAVETTPGLGGAPLLAGAIATFQCRRVERHRGGDHVIYLGRVDAFGARPEAAPLLFYRGRMRRLARETAA